MSTYKITGPTKLSGSASVQGAKNSSMKLVNLPILANDKFTFRNIPNISSNKKPC
ncbi:MAG: hypothetical protein Q9M91_02210 [Candidatus Dojkabacteria bacterium]|nr:hypothetical protein [Candidatus Dojkabacteria bacterium]